MNTLTSPLTIHRARGNISVLATYEKAVVERCGDKTAWMTNAVYKDILIACSVSDDHTMGGFFLVVDAIDR